MVDESTDVACTKHLRICIKYFNSRSNEITSQFLGLIPVIDTTADALYEHVKAFFYESGIDLKLCFGLGTDGAFNLCGCNHSLYTLMKKDNPDLVLIKYVCHFLHLACSNASKEMPLCVDYLLRETFN